MDAEQQGLRPSAFWPHSVPTWLFRGTLPAAAARRVAGTGTGTRALA